MRIAISTGGGDAPGLNAVIRAAVLSAADRGWDVLGIKRGFAGLMGEDEVIPMTRETVRGIAHLGGTILRTTNRCNPFHYPRVQPDGTIVSEDRSDELIENAARLGIDAIISIGGDGSLVIAQRLCDKGMKIVGVPKTIDNDVSGTITTFGFDTAVNTAMEAIDKLHTTAESHDRVIVMEVMGRDAGFIALHSGVAGSRTTSRRSARRSTRATAEAGISRSSSSPKARFRKEERRRRSASRCRGRPGASAGCASRSRGRSRRAPGRRPALSCSVTSSAAACRPATTVCWRLALAAPPCVPSRTRSGRTWWHSSLRTS